MVGSQQVTVFNRFSLRAVVLWLLLIVISAFSVQLYLNSLDQAAQLEAGRKAELERIKAEEEAEKVSFEYSDELITDLFYALLAPPYEKIDIHGSDLNQDAKSWQCVRSNDTQLTWEVKSNDGGMRDGNHTYSWYSAGIANLILGSGNKDGGACLHSDCDTHDYIERVNQQQLCGISDWRLPTTEELATIVHDTAQATKVDRRYFPNTRSYYYWSNTVYADFYDPDEYAHFPAVQAFQYWSEILSINDYSLMTSVNFLNGLPYGARKSRNYHIRLVSGEMYTSVFSKSQ